MNPTIDRFTLEQQLLACWHITEDIDTALKISESEDIDRIQNALIGIKELYEQKFSDLWDTFETLIHTNKI